MKTKLLTSFLFLIFVSTSVFAARPSINALNTRVNQLEAENNAQQSSINDLTSRVQVLEGMPPPPIGRFSDNGDGTVRDNASGLIWTKNATCSGGVRGFYIEDFCPSLSEGQCGLTDGSVPGDWRLPALADLLSLREDAYVDPSWTQLAIPNAAGTGPWSQGDLFWVLDVDLFPYDNIIDYQDYKFATSTLYPPSPTNFYDVNFYKSAGYLGGQSHSDITENIVWCVR